MLYIKTVSKKLYTPALNHTPAFRIYRSQLYCVMCFQIHYSTTSFLPNSCIILHMLVKLKIFVTFFSGTYNARISKILFQGLYKSAIPCDAFSDSSLNNFLFTKHCIILHMMAKLKILVTFFFGTTNYKGF